MEIVSVEGPFGFFHVSSFHIQFFFPLAHFQFSSLPVQGYSNIGKELFSTPTFSTLPFAALALISVESVTMNSPVTNLFSMHSFII